MIRARFDWRTIEGETVERLDEEEAEKFWNQAGMTSDFYSSQAQLRHVRCGVGSVCEYSLLEWKVLDAAVDGSDGVA